MHIMDLFKKGKVQDKHIDEAMNVLRNEKPAHSGRYVAMKAAFDKMHKENNPEVLAVYELLHRAYRAGNMRLIERKNSNEYTFYSPLLLTSVHMCVDNSASKYAGAHVKIGDGVWFFFESNSLAYERALRLKYIADKELSRQEAARMAKQQAESAAKRARQKDELMQLLADVHTRRVR